MTTTEIFLYLPESSVSGCAQHLHRGKWHTHSPAHFFFYKCMRGCHRLPKTQEARWIQYHPPPPNTCQKSAYSLHRPVILWKRGRLLLASCVTLGKVAVDFHPFFLASIWGGVCYCHWQLWWLKTLGWVWETSRLMAEDVALWSLLS